MNIRDLEYFVALVQFGSFAKAAKNCFVSQPTLSMQIQKLEKELGVGLLERNGKTFILSEPGKRVLEEAKIILQKVADIQKIAQDSLNPLVGDFRLGAFPTLAPYYLPKILPAVSKHLPDLKLYLVEDKTDVLVSCLLNGSLDAAFLALPIENDNIQFAEILEEPFFLAVSSSHSLAKKKHVQMSDLIDEELILLEEGHCLRSQALEVCSLNGMKENLKFRASSLETLKQMVSLNRGVTLVPKMAALELENLVYLPFQSPIRSSIKTKNPSRNIALCWRKSGQKSLVVSKILDLVSK